MLFVITLFIHVILVIGEFKYICASGDFLRLLRNNAAIFTGFHFIFRQTRIMFQTPIPRAYIMILLAWVRPISDTM